MLVRSRLKRYVAAGEVATCEGSGLADGVGQLTVWMAQQRVAKSALT